MKAIQVTRETFDKIALEVPPISMETVKQYRDAFVNDEEIYITVPVLEGRMNTIPRIYTGKSFFSKFILMIGQGDFRMFPYDWFEVRAKE